MRIFASIIYCNFLWSEIIQIKIRMTSVQKCTNTFLCFWEWASNRYTWGIAYVLEYMWILMAASCNNSHNSKNRNEPREFRCKVSNPRWLHKNTFVCVLEIPWKNTKLWKYFVLLPEFPGEWVQAMLNEAIKKGTKSSLL